MSELNELKKIKKIYGEEFMHLCRELFPTILEKEGRLLEILSSSFSENSRTLCKDIKDNNLIHEFKNYIFSKIDVETSNKKIIKVKTPYELLDKAGYDLIECTSEAEIQGFKKYYQPDEELCTFNGGRLNSCVVFFAVKKDVKNIKREDFLNPKREDEYGTSVMGIQFSKDENSVVSIKNRYNHTVNNPDATYGNDLDRITPGLTESFEELLQQRGLSLNSSNVQQFELPNYLKASDGKYYKYNMEINGKYYCPGNIIITGGEIHKLEPEKQILIDYFILDKEKKTIKVYDSGIRDCFPKSIYCIEKIEVTKSADKGTRIIKVQSKDKETPIEIKIGNGNQIIGYEDSNVTGIGNNFLCLNKGLTQIDLPNATSIGHGFLNNNEVLNQIDLPNATSIGDGFLNRNEALTKIDIPNATSIGNEFLSNNRALNKIDLPNATSIGDEFLYYNSALTKIDLPKATSIGNGFLLYNAFLKQIDLPNATSIGDEFLSDNKGLTQIDLPNATSIGHGFLNNNEALTKIDIPNATSIGHGFLNNNEALTKIDIPNATSIGNEFLSNNRALNKIDLPNATSIGDEFLYYNSALTKIDLPKATSIGHSFLYNNEILTQIDLPKVTSIGHSFLYNNEILTQIDLPNVTSIGDGFLSSNEALTQIDLPNATSIGDGFLYYNSALTKIDLPKATSIGHSFLYNNEILTQIDLPKVTSIGDRFLYSNEALTQIDLPGEKSFQNSIEGKRLLEIVEKNKKKNINKKSIAQLDKEANIRTEEDKEISKVFESIKKGENERNDYRL